MKRVAKWSAISLFAVVFMLVLAVGLVLGTQAGSRWALGLVPGLQVEGFQGRLAGLWQAERLVWQSGEDRVELTAPLLEWTPGCLLRRTLCVDKLHAAQIELAFAPTATDPDSGPLKLPDLDLPLAIELGEVQVGALPVSYTHLRAHET